MNGSSFETLWGAIPYPALVVDPDDAIVTAILIIGFVGMVLDQMLGFVARLVTYPE